jgi:hypothetical protein
MEEGLTAGGLSMATIAGGGGTLVRGRRRGWELAPS